MVNPIVFSFSKSAALNDDGVVGRHLSSTFVSFLFDAPILEPDFDLFLGQSERQSEFYPT